MQPTGEGKGSRAGREQPATRIEKRDVTLGLQTATDVEILSGLQENEMVVFGEQGQYKPGELVAPKVVDPPSAE